MLVASGSRYKPTCCFISQKDPEQCEKLWACLIWKRKFRSPVSPDGHLLLPRRGLPATGCIVLLVGACLFVCLLFRAFVARELELAGTNQKQAH